MHTFTWYYYLWFKKKQYLYLEFPYLVDYNHIYSYHADSCYVYMNSTHAILRISCIHYTNELPVSHITVRINCNAMSHLYTSNCPLYAVLKPQGSLLNKEVKQAVVIPHRTSTVYT